MPGVEAQRSGTSATKSLCTSTESCRADHRSDLQRSQHALRASPEQELKERPSGCANGKRAAPEQNDCRTGEVISVRAVRCGRESNRGRHGRLRSRRREHKGPEGNGTSTSLANQVGGLEDAAPDATPTMSSCNLARGVRSYARWRGLRLKRLLAIPRCGASARRADLRDLLLVRLLQLRHLVLARAGACAVGLRPPKTSNPCYADSAAVTALSGALSVKRFRGEKQNIVAANL